MVDSIENQLMYFFILKFNSIQKDDIQYNVSGLQNHGNAEMVLCASDKQQKTITNISVHIWQSLKYIYMYHFLLFKIVPNFK